jgi:hypothetical protein
MRRLFLFVCLLAGPGCMADAEHGPFADALKDARGDNMEMRGNMSRLNESTEMPRLRDRD